MTGTIRTSACRARPLVSALALAAGLGAAGAAQAAVTAQQVWDDYKSQMEQAGTPGLTIGSENLAGGVLTVTDVGLEIAGEAGAVTTVSIASIVLTENGDGSVAVTTSDDIPLTITTPADPATATAESIIALAIRQTGMTMTVSGDPGALTYDLAAERFAVELDSINEGGVEIPAEASMALNGVVGTTTSTITDMRSGDIDLSAASLDLLVDATSPEDGSTFNLTGTIADVALQGSSTTPLNMAEAPDAALMNGLAFDGGYTYGASEYAFQATDATGPTAGRASVAGGELSLAINADQASYASTARTVAVEIASPMMPFPVNATIAEYGATLQVPLAKTDAPADWALGVNLTDLAVNEEIWAAIDPQAMLPRDPATVVLDLAGTATLFYDLVDPAQEAAMEAAAAPGEINSVTINDLTVSIAGAQVIGTGAFTLDNTDTTTFAGIPRPEGSADFQINGVNGLMDTLVAMGLIPEAQVSGARMMLGLLAVPGEGDDQLTSRIEVTPEGALLANGQRLQ